MVNGIALTSESSLATLLAALSFPYQPLEDSRGALGS